ncbi:DUF6986 family protein, partial [Nocardia brasiliensis]|uniref:DUF6986 family protein n=1 Tax=Nocardia brasiliensis TaxID=37326 RepID=UPI003D77A82D
DRRSGGVMDEPATAEALAATVLHGLDCGARTPAELTARAPPPTARRGGGAAAGRAGPGGRAARPGPGGRLAARCDGA